MGWRSPDDWKVTTQGFPQYIVDPKHIWHLVPGTVPKNYKLKYSWNKDSSWAGKA
jgi:hypothetical protein